MSWEGHQKQFMDKQKRLRDLLNQFNKNNCGNSGHKLPSDAWKWATTPAPSKPAPKYSNISFSIDWETFKQITGLTGAALIFYLIISEGSRIVFPIRNLIPVL